MELIKKENPEAVEELIFKVSPDFIDRFLEIDHDIWTKMLSQCPGFVSKEVWLSKDCPGEITQIIYWTDISLWKSIPQEELNQTQIEFDTAVGEGNYEWVGAPHESNQKFKIMEYK